MKNKLKVFYICNWYNSIYNQIFNNLDNDIDLTMILSSKFPDFKNNNYKVKVLPTIDFSDYLYFWKKQKDNFLIWYKKDLENFIQKEKPDVIISNLIYLPSTYQTYKISKKYNIKFILQTEMKFLPKGFEKLFFNIYDFLFGRKIANGANKIIGWSSLSKDFIKKRYNLKEKKLDFISPSIDLKKFKPLSRKNQNKKLEILMVARFLEYKRHLDILKAAEILIENNFTNFKINFLGKGPIKEKIKIKVKELNLENYINFIGFIEYKQIPFFIGKNDILVLPSYNEAIGICVIEGLACGLPCIVSNTSGAIDYIKTNKNGFIFKTGNFKELAKKILKFQNKKFLEKFSKNSVENSKKFSDKNIGKQFSILIKN